MKTYAISSRRLAAGDGSAPTSGLRADVRAAVREERAALADPVRRVTREIVREELAAANPTPAEKVRRAAQEARALSTDPSERKRIALAAVRGIGAGLTSLPLDDLTRAAVEAIGCRYDEAVLALTTEDAR
jgi:hypothetical protein